MATYFYHATGEDREQSILESGLSAGSYLTTSPEIATYYASTIEDEDRTPVVLRIDASLLGGLEGYFEPDYPSIEEPITTVIGRSEAAIQAEWQASGRTWQDSLQIVSSVRTIKPIPASAITRDPDYHMDEFSIS